MKNNSSYSIVKLTYFYIKLQARKSWTYSRASIKGMDQICLTSQTMFFKKKMQNTFDIVRAGEKAHGFSRQSENKLEQVPYHEYVALDEKIINCSWTLQ